MDRPTSVSRVKTPAPVRWGFLGAGSVLSTALAPAVHAANGAVLQAAAARCARPRPAALRPVTYGSYDTLLADDVDAVYLTLASEAHLPWTLARCAPARRCCARSRWR